MTSLGQNVHPMISQTELLDLAATIRSDKCGGTTGHLGLIMSTKFTLVTVVVGPSFLQGTHSGVVDYTGATTVNQHTECRLAHEHLLHVFELEQMIDEQMEKHVMSCFHKDIYVGLKQARIGYTND